MLVVQQLINFLIRKIRMRNSWFSMWKRGVFRHGKEIKGLRGGVHRYAAQAKSAD
jgi:hypothetical protein